MSRKLYVVATPIGSWATCPTRRRGALVGHLVAAESSSHRLFLARWHIRQAHLLQVYNGAGRARRIIDELREGATWPWCRTGTPGISDPGETVISRPSPRFEVVPLPGPTFVPALLVSGLPTEAFMFRGFLPRKTRERREALAELAGIKATLVFYEAPHRLAAMLADVAEVLGGGGAGGAGGSVRRCAVCWELTKKFERVWRGTLDEVVKAAGSDTRGEIVVVVEGAVDGDTAGEARTAGAEARSEQDRIADAAAEAVARVASDDISLKDAAGQVASERRLPARRVYAEAIRVRESAQLRRT